MKRNKIILTGANGFIGTRLLNVLQKHNYRIKCLVREDVSHLSQRIEQYSYSDLLNEKVVPKLFEDVQAVIHLAGITHVSEEKISSEEFEKINVKLTKILADTAMKNGVKRFIFMSSISIYDIDEESKISETSIPNPKTLYGQSKLKAEKILTEFSRENGLDTIIIRPPLVYGSDAPGNFGALLNAFYSKLPLPVGCINNKRTLCCIDNLIDFVLHCLKIDKPINDAYNIADAESVSTKQIIEILGQGAGFTPLIIPVPVIFFKAIGIITRKTSKINKLISTLEIDISKSKNNLGWVPNVSPYAGIKQLAQKCTNKKFN